MMDRLTKPNYTYYDCDFMDSGMAQYMNRLADYEDTGLTPETVKKWIVAERFFEDADINKLIDLSDADREVRLIVLPCKVGDTVWVPWKKEVKAYQVQWFSFYGNADYGLMVAVSRDGGSCVRIVEIGKPAFLTLVEAEAALGGGSDK